MRNGDHVGSYRLVRLIAEGGMGAVYEAMNDALGRRVAVKLMHPCWAHDPEQRRRFFDEARCVNLISHPGLVTIHEYGQLPDGNAYTVMEYLEGYTLGQCQLERPGMPLPLPKLLNIARQVASVLVTVHDKGVVHRDWFASSPERLAGFQKTDSPMGSFWKARCGLAWGSGAEKKPWQETREAARAA